MYKLNRVTTLYLGASNLFKNGRIITCGPFVLSVSMQALTRFVVYNYELLVRRTVHNPGEVYKLTHLIHTPGIYKVCPQPVQEKKSKSHFFYHMKTMYENKYQQL